MEITIKPTAKWRWLNFVELWQFRDLFYVLTWRDIKVRYKQTLIGVLWVVLQPLMSTFIFTVFFGTFVKIPSGKLPYSVFVLIGLIFWGFFSAALSRSSNSLIENQQLVKKVYFPREILPISSVLTAFFDFVVSFGLLLLAVIYLHISINWLFIGVAVVTSFITILAASGLGMLLASINVTYRDVRYVVPYFLQLMIFVSPVIYPLEIVRPIFRYILALNPMSGMIEALRSSLSDQTIADPSLFIISACSAVMLFIIGSAYFQYSERRFADIL